MNKKVLKRKLKFIIDPIYNYLFKANHRRNIQYARYYEKLTVNDHTILYESRDGKSITDSPYAIFKYLITNPEFKEYQHIWSISNMEDLNKVISQYEGLDNVKFVRRNSKEYLKALATCKYLINNSTFQSFFIPKSEQIYINTWHGTPLKSMGFDIPGNPSNSQNVVRNFISADYLISPNEHTTNMFLNSYKLNGVYNGEIIEEGYPRIDLTFNTDSATFQSYLRGLGVALDKNKKTILYAPTWKGKNVSKAKNDMFQIIADMTYLKSQAGKDYNVCIKVHPFLYEQARKFNEVKDILIPDFVDTNELLSVVDILITDYSSIFFDYLVTNKPILFYVWDYDDYQEERGGYLSVDELPGPTLFTIKEIVTAVNNIDKISTDFNEVYKKAQNRFTKHDDGNVTKRLVNYIFHKNTLPLNIINDVDERKKKILIYPGGMGNNGITASFINLMDNIDFNQYDVSIFMQPTNSKESLKNMEKISKNVRFLFRHGLPVYHFFEQYRDKFVHNRGAHSDFTKKLYPEEAYKREYKRFFGRTQFDYVIDFSGYSLFWAKFLLASDAKKKICYMHSDVLADSERTINGRRPHRINLRGLFSVYHRFDKLVSVSPGTMEINKKNLSVYADESKFDYVMNSINPGKILRLSNDVQGKDPDNANEPGQQIKYEYLKSRAIINNPKDYFVWNRPAVFSSAEKLYPAHKFLEKEVTIIGKAITRTDVYCKFSIDDRIIGWINQDSLELLPDSLLFEKQVNKLALLQNVNGNDIWNEPFNIESTHKVSSSKDYKGIIVDVDFEARTQHSIYSRFSINGTLMGWIDSSALKTVKEYPLDAGYRVNLEKSLYKVVKNRKYRKIINHLENRTLEENNLYEYGVISNPGTNAVWSKPYPNLGYKKIMDAKELAGLEVIITKCNRTVKGTYFLCYHAGKQIGWLDHNAVSIIDKPVIISEKTVKKIAEVHVSNDEVILETLEDLGSVEPSKALQKFNGKTVTIDKEAKTLDGVFCHFIYENEAIGWLNKRAFHIIKTLGIEKGETFIPEPSNENYNFVTMGRLSPEKGQDNLIKAFAKFNQGYRNSKLYILGEGPLRKDLSDLIQELNLEEDVFLVGQVDNPFYIMDKCNCFVLSSHYEGQPMVLLEAMTLGMHIIATDIVANRTVLEQGRYGLLVENSIEGLEKGLNQIAKNELDYQPDKFVPDEYNKRAMSTFYRILG